MKIRDKFSSQTAIVKKLVEQKYQNDFDGLLLRLDQIYQLSEKKWEDNLERLKGYKIKYLMIAEAPPWSPSDEPIRYFYHTFNKSWKRERGWKNDINWITAIWKTFYAEAPSRDTEIVLRGLARTGFLLVDSLPFAIDYSGKRNREEYIKLVESCSEFLIEKINNKNIEWSNDVKITFGFKLNARAVMKIFPNGIELASGEVLELHEGLISASGAGFPTVQNLKNIFRLP